MGEGAEESKSYEVKWSGFQWHQGACSSSEKRPEWAGLLDEWGLWDAGLACGVTQSRSLSLSHFLTSHFTTSRQRIWLPSSDCSSPQGSSLHSSTTTTKQLRFCTRIETNHWTSSMKVTPFWSAEGVREMADEIRLHRLREEVDLWGEGGSLWFARTWRVGGADHAQTGGCSDQKTTEQIFEGEYLIFLTPLAPDCSPPPGSCRTFKAAESPCSHQGWSNRNNINSL